jgi:hypothetical protein
VSCHASIAAPPPIALYLRHTGRRAQAAHDIVGVACGRYEQHHGNRGFRAILIRVGGAANNPYSKFC